MSATNKKFLLNCLLINILLVTCISAGLVRREIINKNSPSRSSKTNGTSTIDEVTIKNLELSTTARSSDAKLDSEPIVSSKEKVSDNHVDRKTLNTGITSEKKPSLSAEDTIRDLENVEIIEDEAPAVDESPKQAITKEKVKEVVKEVEVVTEQERETTTEYHFDISK